MRKTLSFYENKTLEIKSCLLHFFFGFYTLFQCDLELMVEGRCTLALELEFCTIPANITYRYRYRLVWYRYHFASGAFLFGGTGTGESGTGTTWPLLNSCLGVPVPIFLVPVPLPLHLFPSIIALPKTSPQWLPSSSMIHIRSLDPNTCNNYA